MSEPNSEKLELLKAVDVLLERTGLSSKMTKEGDEYKGVCPFCGQNGFSFHTMMETYHCQFCLKDGNILKFVISYFPGEIKSRLDAWNWLANMMFDEKAKGRRVDMEGWVLEE